MTNIKNTFEQIKHFDEYGRITLKGGDKTAREHYQKILEENSELEIELIFDLARSDKDVLFAIEERAAIREADGLPGDLESAVLCNFLKGENYAGKK